MSDDTAFTTGFVPLSGQEAVRRFQRDPGSVFFEIDEFAKVFGLSMDEIRSELAKGILRAVGVKVAPDKWTDIRITGDSALEWLRARTITSSLKAGDL